MLTLRDDLDRVVIFERLERKQGPKPVMQWYVARGIEQGGLEGGEGAGVDFSHHGEGERTEIRD